MRIQESAAITNPSFAYISLAFGFLINNSTPKKTHAAILIKKEVNYEFFLDKFNQK